MGAKMRNAFAIISCLTLAVLLVNAQEEDSKKREETTPMTTSDQDASSTSLIMNYTVKEQETTGAPSTESVGTSSDSSIDKIDEPSTENITISTPMEISTMTVPLNTTEDGGMTMTNAVVELDDPVTVTPLIDLAATDLPFMDSAATDLPFVDLATTNPPFINLADTDLALIDLELTDIPLTDLPVDTLDVDADVNTKLPVLTLTEETGNQGTSDVLTDLFGNLSGEELDSAMGDFLDIILESDKQKKNQGTTDSYTEDIMDMTTLVPEPEVEVTDSSSSASVQPSRNFSFLVYDNQNIPCTLASMSIKLKVQYTDVYKDKHTKEIEVPENAGVIGTCGNEESNMTLFWMDGLADDGQSNITFQIVKDHESFYVNNVQVRVFLDESQFPHTEEVIQTGNSTRGLKLFSASVKDGIHVCQSQTEVDCGKITVLIKDVSLVAFNDRLDVSNRKEKHCSFKISMASIVGGIIGTLVVICIVSSIIWYRKRSNNYRSELP